MLEGFYTSLSGILVQQRTLSVLSNNMVNVKTPGFKEERVVSSTFHEAVMQRTENGTKTAIGTGDPIRTVENVFSVNEAAALNETGRPFDMAIVGNGYFNIKNGEQNLVTRNGCFDMDAEGYLVLEGAGRVQGENGDIPVASSDFTVQADGNLYSADGTLIDRLLITAPGEGEELKKFTNGLYTAPENNEQLNVDEYQTVQNNLEMANFDVNREYTLMMEAQRAFQSCSSALKMMDGISQKAATQIAAIV